MAQRTDSRSRMIHAAELFCRRGYHATAFAPFGLSSPDLAGLRERSRPGPVPDLCRGLVVRAQR